MKKELWCVHIIGPDDLYAAPSKEEAEERVAAQNDWINNDPKLRESGIQAEVLIWPYTSESHTESLTHWRELFNEGSNVKVRGCAPDELTKEK